VLDAQPCEDAEDAASEARIIANVARTMSSKFTEEEDTSH
jgi:hypothetical protein